MIIFVYGCVFLIHFCEKQLFFKLFVKNDYF